MKFLEENKDCEAASKCDVGVGQRNPWHWHWLQEKCENGVPFSKWAKKINDPGKCFCVVCFKVLNYGSSGKKALKVHANSPEHNKKFSSTTSSAKLVNTSDTDIVTCTITDKCSEVKSLVSLFLAEHCLPYTLAPDLIAFAKKASADPASLNSVSMNRTAATYITTHGVGHSVKKSLAEKLKGTHFSLNVDEATNNAGDKVLNVMVQFYDESIDEVLVQLLGSRVVNLATAENITSVIESILEERGLRWDQVVSVMMDNCNVMRGVREGVEAKIRRKNNSLLDISGDCVHMLNNAAKKIFTPIEDFSGFQSLCSEIYLDIEDSPKARSLFASIQEILYQKKRTIFRPIPNRFNQMLTVSNRICDLWDALLVYYSAFLAKDEKEHKIKVKEIFKKYSTNDEQQSFILNILKKQKDQDKSSANVDRKGRIVQGLFDKEDQTFATINLYQGILAKFEIFIKKFQSVKPQAHALHTEIFQIVKDFYSFFIKPDHIPILKASCLNKIKFEDEKNQLRDSQLFVGEKGKAHILICTKDKSKHGIWLNKFFSALRLGYIKAAPSIKKLPLMNSTLIRLASLTPSLQRSEQTASALCLLAQDLPNVIDRQDIGPLDSELKSYTTSREISLLEVDEDDPDFRIDLSWWSKIFKMKEKGVTQFPILSRLIKALLSIFSGPLVESSFNIMDDIMEADRTRLTEFNYEALAMIKSELSAKKLKATTMEITPAMKESVATSYKRYELFLSKKNEQGSSTSAKKQKSASQVSAQASLRIGLPKSSITTTQSDQILPLVESQPTIIQDQPCPHSSSIQNSIYKPPSRPSFSQVSTFKIPRKATKATGQPSTNQSSTTRGPDDQLSLQVLQSQPADQSDEQNGLSADKQSTLKRKQQTLNSFFQPKRQKQN